MQQKLHDYLSEIKLDTNYFSYFEDASITDVSLNEKDNKLSIEITMPSLFDVEVYKELINKKNNFPNKTSIYFKISNMPSDAIVTDYYRFFVELSYRGTLLDSLKSIFVELYNKQLIVNVTSSIIKESLDALKPTLEKCFERIGLDVPFVVIFNNHEEDFDEEINKEDEERRKEYVSTISFDASDISNVNYRDIEIQDIKNDSNFIRIKGRVFQLDSKLGKNNIRRFTFYVTNEISSVTIKTRNSKNMPLEVLNSIDEGNYIECCGSMSFDNYSKDYILTPHSINKIDPPEHRKDEASEKRVELHLHTKNSAMDGVNYIKDFVNRAAEWGHKAIAVTDHGSTQSFPEAQDAAEGKDIKILYGLEGYVCNNKRIPIIHPVHELIKDATYVVFDLETTGLSTHYDKITEMGFVKIKNGIIVDTWQQFVNPLQRLHPIISDKTNITDDMLVNQPTIDELIPKLLDFIGDSVLVAHNGTFDMGFLNEALLKNGYSKLKNTLVETLDLAHCVFPNLKRFSLGAICKNVGIQYDDESAHRADYDARVLSELFLEECNVLEELGVQYLDDVNELSPKDSYLTERPYHVNFLVKNQDGLKSLYKMLSKALTEYIAETPVIIKDFINEYRENLFVGAGCFNSEVFDIAQTRSYNELKEVIRFYDYIEVQPLENYQWLLDTERILTKERLIQILKDIVKAAKEENKIVVATGDVHYLDPTDKIYRDILIVTNAVGKRPHPLKDGRFPNYQYSPAQHFRTTQEMIDGMSYLEDDKLIKELVIDNPNYIADQIEVIKPIKKILRTPKVEGVDSDLEIRRMCEEKAHAIYGENLPTIVKERMDKELEKIIQNGYSVIYYLAYRLVKKSNSDGYLVGSRGSVGSSFVASLCGITEVNPLAPHYVCPHCHHSEFFTDGSVRSGFDLPEKECPECGNKMKGNGQNIPFETFLGFHGEKVPDIDLNFSRDYQSTAHDYTKVLCGEKNVFRGGTISKISDKTGYGYAKGYFEAHEMNYPNTAELRRLAKGIDEVKRTSGQHPAGIIVIPDNLDVFDFTPIQYPADDVTKDWITTHYKYDYLHEDVLKLDILGHLDPMALKMLRDLTGIDPETIPMNDPRVFSLFSGLDELGVNPDDVLNTVGVSGIPEFGTSFVKPVVEECHPSKFSDLVQISGLTHGKEVWQGNAQDLIKSGQHSLMDVIGCRDDIMTDLINFGMEKSDAFEIMEFVRKGKPNKEPEKWIKVRQKMVDAKIPDWYIESCHKINYMFPKAHAVAYVVMGLRVAWFKVHYPLEYYATYFSIRCDQFDTHILVRGHDAIKQKVIELRTAIQQRTNSSTDKDLLETMELALEMTARGYKFHNIDLNKSDATRFVCDHENKALYPPFITLKGLGESAATSVIEARKEKPFTSKEDLLGRTKLSKTNVDELDSLGALTNFATSDVDFLSSLNWGN